MGRCIRGLSDFRRVLHLKWRLQVKNYYDFDLMNAHTMSNLKCMRSSATLQGSGKCTENGFPKDFFKYIIR